MRNYDEETKKRVAFIQNVLSFTKADGIVYGNSGGKDSALVGILCKMACDNVLAVLMPCSSKRNYEEDFNDAKEIAQQYDIPTRVVDLTATKQALQKELEKTTTLSKAGINNIAPRLRMSSLYAIASSENRIIAGTGNRSESYMGYFTKWGDAGYDFNPIADLTVTEIYEFLTFLKAPEFILTKKPSAGLFDGQTDEGEMGITYKKIDDFLLHGVASTEDKAILDRFHALSEHKRNPPYTYSEC